MFQNSKTVTTLPVALCQHKTDDSSSIRMMANVAAYNVAPLSHRAHAGLRFDQGHLGCWFACLLPHTVPVPRGSCNFSFEVLKGHFRLAIPDSIKLLHISIKMAKEYLLPFSSTKAVGIRFKFTSEMEEGKIPFGWTSKFPRSFSWHFNLIIVHSSLLSCCWFGKRSIRITV